MAAEMPEYNVESAVPHRGRKIGEFFFQLVLWILIGMLVQWLMPDSSRLATEAGEGMVQASFWNALGVVALFFTVLAFLLRDFSHTNAVAKGLSLVATRVLATTLDIGVFGFGGYLLLVLLGDSADMQHVSLWQELFFSNIYAFIVSLVVFAVLLFFLRCTNVSLVSLSALEYKPLLRVGIYLLLIVVLLLIAFFIL